MHDRPEIDWLALHELVIARALPNAIPAFAAPIRDHGPAHAQLRLLLEQHTRCRSNSSGMLMVTATDGLSERGPAKAGPSQ